MAKSPTKNRNKKKRNDYKLGLCLTSLRSLPCGKDWVKIAQDKNMHEATVRRKLYTAFSPGEKVFIQIEKVFFGKTQRRIGEGYCPCGFF